MAIWKVCGGNYYNIFIYEEEKKFYINWTLCHLILSSSNIVYCKCNGNRIHINAVNCTIV